MYEVSCFGRAPSLPHPFGEMLAHLANLPYSRRQLCTIFILGGSAASGIKEPSRCDGTAEFTAASLPNPQVALKFRFAFAPHIPRVSAQARLSSIVNRKSSMIRACPRVSARATSFFS